MSADSYVHDGVGSRESPQVSPKLEPGCLLLSDAGRLAGGLPGANVCEHALNFNTAGNAARDPPWRHGQARVHESDRLELDNGGGVGVFGRLR